MLANVTEPLNTRRSQMSEAIEAIKIGMCDELEDLRELEHRIYIEHLLSDEYLRECARHIKKWDRKELASLGNYSVPYKTPFKVRFRNFWNKVLKTFGYGRTE